MSTDPAPPTPFDKFSVPSFDTFYDCYYQELLSETLSKRWQFLDNFTSIIVALTATGSGVAAWTIWNTVSGKTLWAVVAGTAAVASVVNIGLKVPDRIKEQELLYRLFQDLRLAIDNFRGNLRIDMGTMDEARKEYDRLQAGYQEAMKKAKPDMFYSSSMAAAVEAKLKDILKEKRYIL